MTEPISTTNMNSADSFTRFAVDNRKAFAGLLLLAGLIFAALGGFALYRGLTQSATSQQADKPDKADKADKPDNADNPPSKPAEVSKSSKINNTEWIGSGAIGLAAGLIALGFGFVQAAGVPKSNANENISDARSTILIVGGAIGALLILLGVFLFFMRLDSLNDWLVLGKTKAMTSVIVTVLVALVGAAIAFFSVIPAKAEERNNPTIRKLVHGANAAITTLILIAGLIGLNALISLKFPGQLDTTDSGFYTLDTKTKELISSLDKRVTIYNFLGEDTSRLTTDTEKLLADCQMINPSKLNIRQLTFTNDKKEISSLFSQFPQYPIARELGLLMVSGEGENKQSAFISANDLAQAGKNGEALFVGEGRLVRELLYLADNKNPTVIYITQGTGEPTLLPSRNANERSFGAFAEKLKSVNCEVKALEPRAAKIPGDANILIVADPLASLPVPTLQAISDYIKPLDPKAKKGKLILLSGAHLSSDRSNNERNGLEPILETFGIRLGTKQIFTQPEEIGNRLRIDMPSCEVNANIDSPFVREFSSRITNFRNCREVTIQQSINPNVTVESIISTRVGLSTFLDIADLRTVGANYQAILDNEKLQADKQFTSQPRSVGVVVRENKSTQMFVFGTAYLDDPQMLTALVDEMRDRPEASSIARKEYGTYKPPAADQFTKIFWLPVLLIPLAIAAAGIGVWIVRRN